MHYNKHDVGGSDIQKMARLIEKNQKGSNFEIYEASSSSQSSHNSHTLNHQNRHLNESPSQKSNSIFIDHLDTQSDAKSKQQVYGNHNAADEYASDSLTSGSMKYN